MGISAVFCFCRAPWPNRAMQLLGKEVPAFVNKRQNSRPKTVFSIDKQPCEEKRNTHQSQNKQR